MYSYQGNEHKKCILTIFLTKLSGSLRSPINKPIIYKLKRFHSSNVISSCVGSKHAGGTQPPVHIPFPLIDCRNWL